MSEEAKRERSKNCPSIPLSGAIEYAKKLYSKAGKTKIKAEVAVNALGYAGLNGAALTTLGALSQYGLINRDKGSIVSISDAAVRLMHPVNRDQEMHTLEELALNPKVFNELYTDGFHDGTEDLIANHLIQNGFTPDKAKKAAMVFKANIDLAKLKGDSITSADEKKDDLQQIEKPPTGIAGSSGLKADLTVLPAKKNMLAQYSIPLGANEATITFTGEKLSVEDFDALCEYVDIFKKQFERRMVAAQDPTLERISGTISTQPQQLDNRINFLLAIEDGRVFTCISGSGTDFKTSEFINGKKLTLLGQRVSDYKTGTPTPMFIFRSVE